MRNTCIPFLLAAALSLIGIPGSSAQSGARQPGNTRPKAAAKGPHWADPKCVFLRQEYRRIQQEGENFAAKARFSSSVTVQNLAFLGATVEEFADFIAASEEFAARLSVLSLKIRACEWGQPLSSKERLPSISAMRERHAARVKARWLAAGGSEDAWLAGILVRINTIYDGEIQSLFISDSIPSGLDPDIAKDYPDILTLIRESTLPPEQKAYLENHSRFIRYEEAGRLYNIFKGIDTTRTPAYAYEVRQALAERAEQARAADEAEAAKKRAQAEKERTDHMTWIYAVVALAVVALGAVVVFRNSPVYAKYSAIREGKLRKRYWWGAKELILWEPGEAVVLLKDKKLVAVSDPTGGVTSISAWAGEEYKGRISYKTQLMQYASEPIYTSDGVEVRLDLGIWWRIHNPGKYIYRIATDYHVNDRHFGEPRDYSDDPRGEKYYDRKLMETAEKWIRLLASSTLREYICEMPVAKLISPAVQAYIDFYFQPPSGAPASPPGEPAGQGHQMPARLEGARAALNEKTMDYGISIEKLEVNKLDLPEKLQEKLAAVRVSFLEPRQAEAVSEAETIGMRRLNEAQLNALRELADIIGQDNVAKIEFIKAVGLARIPFTPPYAPPLSVLVSGTGTPQGGAGSAPLELPSVLGLPENRPAGGQSSGGDRSGQQATDQGAKPGQAGNA